MGKKKGAKKGGGGGEDAAAEGKVDPNAEFQKPTVLLPDTNEWVTLDLKLLNWRFMDTKMRVRTNTHVFTLKKKLQDRHGRIEDLVLCSGRFTESNELMDEMKTLAEYGIKGSTVDQPAMETIVYYDFKPCHHDEPLLLVWNK